MAELYLGRVVGPAGFEKLVAIKRVLPQRTEETDFVRMFEQEARTAATLDHANVVKVMDFGIADVGHYLVMEYLHGRDLFDVRRTVRSALPLEVALAIGIATAHGLHYVHERTGSDGRPLGLVHRDISPSNVFLCFTGEVKVVDFGIAKATAATMGTRSGALKGKIAYMSPEQCKGAAIDRRSDIHSLGNILYGLTTGRRMYNAANEFGLLNVVASGEIVPPSATDPDFPDELEAILLRAVAYEPDARFSTAKALADALERFAVEHGMRGGPSAVAEFMEGAFGSVPYPSIGSTRLASSTVAEPTEGPTTPYRRAPRRGGLGVALGVGAAIGLSIWAAGAVNGEHATDAVVGDVAPTLAPSPVAPIAPAPAAVAVPVPMETPEAAPKESTTPAVVQTPTPERRPKRKKTKRRAAEPTAAARPGPSDIFLPPSQRKK
jgi:hypothetical protein